MNKNSLIFIIIFSFVTTFFLVAILAFINEFTKERVIQNQREATIETLLSSLEIPYDKTNSSDTLKKFESLQKYEYKDEKIGDPIEGNVFESKVDIKNVIFSTKDENGEDVYAKIFEGSGLWGKIRIVLAVDSKLERVIGMKILFQAETPGLGSRIEEPWFQNQFDGRKIPANLILKFTGGGNEDARNNKESELVDGITGATRTVEGVSALINNSLKTYGKILGIKVSALKTGGLYV